MVIGFSKVLGTVQWPYIRSPNQAQHEHQDKVRNTKHASLITRSIQAELWLCGGSRGRATVPVSAQAGSYEFETLAFCQKVFWVILTKTSPVLMKPNFFAELQTREPDSTTYPMKTYQYFEPETETETFRVETTSRQAISSADHRQRSVDDHRCEV